MFWSKKKKEEQQLGTSFDRLLYYTFIDKKTIDEQFMELAETLVGDRAVVANFEEISNTAEINRAVAFLSGICYAFEGEVHRIGKETFIFATKKALADGTIHHFMRDVATD